MIEDRNRFKKEKEKPIIQTMHTEFKKTPDSLYDT